MKRFLLAGCFFVTLMLTAATARADTWGCTYTGTWTGGGGGSFVWALTWVGTGGGSYKVNGDYADKYGASTLSGNCDASHACTFDQRYSSGQLAGKSYFWQGKYTDAAAGAGKTINTFTGTWGNSAANRGDGGGWKAKAVCVQK